MKNIFIALLLIVSFIACQEQNKKLSLNLKKGETYHLTINSNATVNQGLFGQNISVAVKLMGKMSYKVVGVEDDYYDLDVKYDSLKVIQELPQGIKEFSTDKTDNNDPLSRIFSMAIENVFKMKMAKSGKILEVKNIDSFIKSLVDDRNNLTESQKKDLIAQMSKVHSEKSFKGNISMVTAIFPDTIVEVGDKWTINSELANGLPALMKGEFELKERNSDYAIITSHSIINTADSINNVSIISLPFKYHVSGILDSEIKVDSKSGWVIEAKINQEVKGGTTTNKGTLESNMMNFPFHMTNVMLITNE